MLELVGITMLVLMPICVIATLAKTPEPEQEIRSVVPVMKGLKLMAL